MNTGLIFELLIIQIIVIFGLIAVIMILIRTRNNIKLDKKFSKYTISPINYNTTSFFDKVIEFLNKIIKKISKVLLKLKILNKYASLYEKHITYDELKTKQPMDYISTKFLIGFFITILYLLTNMFQYKSISFFGILLSFLIGFFVIDIYIQYKYHKKKKQIEDDLLKAIIIMNNSFQSGRSIVQSIEIVKNELTGPISDEFKKIYLDISYGLSLEVVFDRFYKRVKLDDVKYITCSLTLLNKTGGNIVKVFATIEREFFSKKKLMNELKTMTASSVFVFKILLILPFILYMIIFLLNKDYFAPLFKTTIGIVVLIFMVLLYILYILFIKKILKVEI